jgi:VWFA-related protein
MTKPQRARRIAVSAALLLVLVARASADDRRPQFEGAIAVASLLLGLPALPDDAPPKFEGGIEIVAVDANVVDGKGQPVRDVAPEEFVVKVDGRARRVLSAEFIELRMRTSPGPASPAEAGAPEASAPQARVEGRRIVIAVDRGQLGGSVHLATKAVSRLLDQLGPDDRVAVFPLPSGPRVDFTADRAAIDKVLGKIGPLQDRWISEFNISYAEALTLVDGRSRFSGGSAIGLRECEKTVKEETRKERTGGVPRPHVIEQCLLRVEAEAMRQVEDHERSVQERLNALEALCQALARVPGPKALVLISGGFTAAMSGGRDNVAEHLRRIATAAAASRVSLYSIYYSHRVEAFDASRSREQYTPDEDRRIRSAGLGELTGRAGGAMFEVVAGADFAFDRVASETSAHYLLGLEPGKRDRDGKPHDIEVKVLRKGVEVRARRQFVMPNAFTPPRVARARPIAPTPPASPIRLKTHMLRGGSAGQIMVVLAAQVDGFSDARFDVKVLDPAGAVVGTLEEHVGTAEGGPVRHEETILLRRGLYTLKAEAVDAAGRRALVERPLNAELSHGVGFDVSDLLLFESVGEKLRLSASGSMAGNSMAVYLELYMDDELPTDRLVITVEVIASDGASRSATVLPLRKDAAKGLLYAEGVVDLWALPPGAYVARAVVTSGPKVARRVERAFDYKGPDPLAGPINKPEVPR